MLWTERMMAPTESGSRSETAEVIEWWEGGDKKKKKKSNRERIRWRDSEREHETRLDRAVTQQHTLRRLLHVHTHTHAHTHTHTHRHRIIVNISFSLSSACQKLHIYEVVPVTNRGLKGILSIRRVLCDATLQALFISAFLPFPPLLPFFIPPP